jgi:hypothetical protein
MLFLANEDPGKDITMYSECLPPFPSRTICSSQTASPLPKSFIDFPVPVITLPHLHGQLSAGRALVPTISRHPRPLPPLNRLRSGPAVNSPGGSVSAGMAIYDTMQVSARAAAAHGGSPKPWGGAPPILHHQPHPNATALSLISLMLSTIAVASKLATGCESRPCGGILLLRFLLSTISRSLSLSNTVAPQHGRFYSTRVRVGSVAVFAASGFPLACRLAATSAPRSEISVKRRLHSVLPPRLPFLSLSLSPPPLLVLPFSPPPFPLPPSFPLSISSRTPRPSTSLSLLHPLCLDDFLLSSFQFICFHFISNF